LREIAEACIRRGYQYAAVTDHSYGLKIAGGMSMADATRQRSAIEEVNAARGNQFRMLQGIEANIDAVGRLDLSEEEAATFDVVWPRRIRGSEGTRIRPTDARRASRIRQFGFSPTSRAHRRIARGCRRRLEHGVRIGGRARRRHRNRWRSRAAGSRPHAGRSRS
jgi:hypothetical protein